MHGRAYPWNSGETSIRSQECVASPECHNFNNSSSSWNALNPLSSYVYRLIYMKVLTQVWRPCRDVIFHVWLKQTIRIFLPCKFTAECTNKIIFIILEVGIFQNQNCDLVSVMVCHLPAIWSVIFRSCKFSAPAETYTVNWLATYRPTRCAQIGPYVKSNFRDIEFGLSREIVNFVRMDLLTWRAKLRCNRWLMSLWAYLFMGKCFLSVAARGYLPPRANVCVAPLHPVAYLEIWRYISCVHFQKFSNFSIFFHSKYHISTIFSHPKVPWRMGTPLDTPLVPPVRSAIDILMVTRRQWCGLWICMLYV